MFFAVDNEKCIQDNICVDECPAKILSMEGDGPVMVEGGEEICIRCGHCVAVCPVEAVGLDFLKPEDCIDIDKSLLPNEEQAHHFLTSRRSIRTYSKKNLPKEIIEKVLAVASCAPTGSNRQPVKWLVFHQREQVEAIAAHVIDWMKYVVVNHPEVAATMNMQKIIDDAANGIDRICRDAPHLVFTYSAKEFSVAPADCHTAIAYLELLLPVYGAGSCWAGYVNGASNQWPPLKEYLKLPEDHLVHGAAMIGYPEYEYYRIPPRNQPNIEYR
ncbi:nitroreductase family protein [Desulfosediminicola flagellatus]|uniref:nitroreductase family protein n=1 Tax=Desulfosediminicola flagellatus TaxID=2569541 RepID=UPI0010AC8A9B|nr:nitroreductase family protein [Desulfosediminicola flagellatus]